MPTDKVQYKSRPGNLQLSVPNKFDPSNLRSEEMIVNLGPQHPSTHGVLRLEVLMDGEIVKDVVPHIGYLHRCFEKHAENLPYNQVIPFVDRLDYVSSMNNEHAYAMGVERMLGISEQMPKRVEYVRVLVAELNRIASHFIAIGTYGMDIGAFTPFFWLMRDREHILRMLEWASGARLLYNYIWIGMRCARLSSGSLARRLFQTSPPARGHDASPTTTITPSSRRVAVPLPVIYSNQDAIAVATSRRTEAERRRAAFFLPGSERSSEPPTMPSGARRYLCSASTSASSRRRSRSLARPRPATKPASSV